MGENRAITPFLWFLAHAGVVPKRSDPCTGDSIFRFNPRGESNPVIPYGKSFQKARVPSPICTLIDITTFPAFKTNECLNEFPSDEASVVVSVASNILVYEKVQSDLNSQSIAS